MAEHFKTVHALDVSEGMIDYARKHVSAQNVSFHIVNGNTIPLPDASVTAVFSTRVFQHLDSPDDATSYFRETARVLSDRGSIMIHLPILIWPGDAPPWVRRAYQVRRTLSFARIRNALKRRAITKGRFVPFMSMRSYQLEYLFGTLRECGFRDIDMLIFVTKSNNDPHPFVMARKGE